MDTELSFEEGADAREGQVLGGRYELLMPIATGGMGHVWAARLKGSHGFKKLIAIKTMRRDIGCNQRMVDMMAQEAYVASMIHHPNVVETFELGECAGSMYMAMEFVDGETLMTIKREAEKTGGVPLNIALNLVGQVCRGLHAAHELRDEQGVSLQLVHRDVNPQNVIVSFDGVAKLLDFGVAKIGIVDSMTQAGELKGKLRYMAPEQLLQEEVDRRADVFALGLMLYLVTLGVHPFSADATQYTFVGILTSNPVRPTEIDPKYPRELESVVLKALAKNKEERWGSARDFLSALQLAVPEAFAPGMDHEVVEYLHTLLCDRMLKRRRLIQRAEERLESSSRPTNSTIIPRSSMTACSATVRIEPPVRRSSTPKMAGLAAGAMLAVGSALVYSATHHTKTPAPVVEQRTRPKANVTEYAPMVVYEGVLEAPRRVEPIPSAAPARLAAPPAKKQVKSDSPYTDENWPTSGLDVIDSGVAAPEPPPVPPAAAPQPPRAALPAPAPPPALPPGPRNVSARAGHAQLRVNPNADPYRPVIPASLSRFSGLETAVRICVNPSGLVQSVTVTKSLGAAIDKRVVTALSRWVYSPLKDGGAPITFCYPLIYSF